MSNSGASFEPDGAVATRANRVTCRSARKPSARRRDLRGSHLVPSGGRRRGRVETPRRQPAQIVVAQDAVDGAPAARQLPALGEPRPEARAIRAPRALARRQRPRLVARRGSLPSSGMLPEEHGRRLARAAPAAGGTTRTRCRGDAAPRPPAGRRSACRAASAGRRSRCPPRPRAETSCRRARPRAAAPAAARCSTCRRN